MPNLGINMPGMGKLRLGQNGLRTGGRQLASSDLTAPTSLADALFTTTQQRVLALLFGQPSRSFYSSELIGMTGSGSGAVQRELKRLASSGLVTVKRIGKQKHYQANPDSPVFEELRRLVLKTVAMVDPIWRALQPLAGRVSLALVYGSVVKGTDTAASDIDLLLVADDVTLEDVYSALGPVEAELQRKVNPSLYTSAEFARRSAAGNAFLARVLAGEHLVLMGGEIEPSAT